LAFLGSEDPKVTFSLEGKVALVTGAAGGIGRAYATALGEAGASVVLADLKGDEARMAAEELTTRGIRAVGVDVDVASEESVGAMADSANDAFGGIDILVNNAGLMAELPQDSLIDYPLDWWNRVFEVNLTGALICCRACVPSMIARGGGKIINQSSGGAFVNGKPYGISKLALLGLTYGLARDLGEHRINVNAIAPGPILTEAALSMVPLEDPWRTQHRELTPIKMDGLPADLCGALVFLASSASDWMTGQCLSVDGGWIMRF
jgi:NAD(P)-dependent dehydrogenase (short-subunit alcohol dehydrogenase family)